ncbi:methyl-CpG-binding domain-containing protein 5-like isoform X2 [Salvia splendens]|uniref:methyl-CpG-binding domain-containing protein 5-like isoform X2 n=1 Tax=Salvia splendens TaxID=180675 RepID=UPI0011006949|nr:methyl-CpG-binding domain-containing protein 5-like isoform X2 [Salvia splendens]
MSEPQLPPKSEPTSADPLLDTGAYIDPAPNHSPAADIPQPGVVIAAEPISYYIPGEAPAEPAPRAARRRDPEERPSWLPENWMIELRRRNSGATAGQTDRYYIEPAGQRRFRSKVEVLQFLETGSKPKRKAPSETETTPSRTPASQTQRNSSTKRKKSEASVSDNTQPPPPHVQNGVQADNGQPL